MMPRGNSGLGRLVQPFLAIVLAGLLVSTSSMAHGTNEVEEWYEDLRYLVRVLRTYHPDPFRRLPEAEFNQAVEDLEQSLPTLSRSERIVEFARLVAMIGDAHTHIWLGQSNMRFHTYPLRFRWFEDGIYLVAATSEYSHLVGAKLVKLGETTLEEVVDQLSSVVSHENRFGAREACCQYLTIPEVLAALGLVPGNLLGSFTFEREKGETIQVEVPPVAYAPQLAGPPGPLFTQLPDSDYWVTHLSDSGTLYIRYRRCRDRQGFNREVLYPMRRVFSTESVDRVVIDLRANEGGDSRIILPLINELKDQSRAQDFRVYGLIDNATHSSAMANAIQLKEELDALLVGEPTGGAPCCFGGTISFRLPRSGLELICSTTPVWLSSPTRLTVFPDVVVKQRVEDYLSGTDSGLQAILDGTLQQEISHEPEATWGMKPRFFEILAHHQPSNGRLMVSASLLFKSRGSSEGFYFSLARPFDIVEASCEPAGVLKEVLGGQRWAVYHVEGDFPKGTDFKLNLLYSGVPWGESYELHRSLVAPWFLFLPGEAWLPVPRVYPMADPVWAGDLSPESLHVELTFPDSWTLLFSDWVPGEQKHEWVERESLSAGGHPSWPISILAYTPVSQTLPAASRSWLGFPTAEAQFVSAIGEDLLLRFERALGYPAYGPLVIVPLPPASAETVELQVPGVVFVKTRGISNRAFSDTARHTLTVRTAEAIAQAYVSDPGLAAFLADYMAFGGDMNRYQEAWASRRDRFIQACRRYGDRSIAGASSQASTQDAAYSSEPYLVDKAALIWHMFANYYGDDVVLEIARRLGAEPPRGSQYGASGSGNLARLRSAVEESAGKEALAFLNRWLAQAEPIDLRVSATAKYLGGDAGRERWDVLVAITNESSSVSSLFPWVEVSVFSSPKGEEVPESRLTTRVELEGKRTEATFAVTGRPKEVTLGAGAMMLDHDPGNNHIKMRPRTGAEILITLLCICSLFVSFFALGCWFERRAQKAKESPPRRPT